MRKIIIILSLLIAIPVFVVGVIVVTIVGHDAYRFWEKHHYAEEIVGPNQVSLLNRAGEPIAQGRLIVLGRAYEFERLAVGETARISFPIRGEGAYIVEVQFQSGKKLSSDELGYFTSGMAIDDLVEIRSETITIVRSDAKMP